MKAARLTVLAVAVLAAGGAMMLAARMANNEPEAIVQEANQLQIELSEVLVASEELQVGKSLSETSLRWQQWPQELVTENFVTRSARPDAIAELSTSIARSPIFMGEPIRVSKLVQSDRGYMSAILPAGQRAVATSISTDTSAGGFILPNDRVDVIMTRRDTSTEDSNKFLTETILRNIRVLAIDQTIQEKEGEPVVVGSTATLQLSPEQAEILTVAQQMADRLTLALRSLSDSGPESETVSGYLLTGDKGRKGTVRVIKFGQSSEVFTAN